MKIVFFTDVHLVSKSNINRIDNLPETQKLKLNELVDVCNNGDIDYAFSSGDIFDRHTPAITTMNTFTRSSFFLLNCSLFSKLKFQIKKLSTIN